MQKCKDCGAEYKDEEPLVKCPACGSKRIEEAIISCNDCGAEKGQYHKEHCDIERCPKCGGQLLSCDCDWTHLYHDAEKDESYLIDKTGKKWSRHRVRTAVDM